jgi:predicted nucleic acid-binding protein
VSRRPKNPLEGAPPRTLLAFWAATASVFNASHVKPAPSRKSRRGRKQYDKARRAKALSRRLQLSTWRSYYEEEKRRARAEA